MTILFEYMDVCVQESMLRVIENQFNQHEIDGQCKAAAEDIVNTILQAYQKIYEAPQPATDDGE